MPAYGSWRRCAVVPRVLVVHINPRFEGAIRQGVAVVAAELGAEIVVGSEGMRVRV